MHEVVPKVVTMAVSTVMMMLSILLQCSLFMVFWFMIYELWSRDVACHVDSTICHPDARREEGFRLHPLYETETLRFAQSDMERRISLHLSDSAFNWLTLQRYENQTPFVKCLGVQCQNRRRLCQNVRKFCFYPRKPIQLFSYSNKFSFVGGGIKATPIYI